MPSPSARAAQVLERLASDHGDPLDEPPPPRVAPAGRRLLGLCLAAVCVAGVGAVLLLDRRPPPVEEQLPLADAGTPSSSPSSPAQSSPSSTVASGDDAADEVVVHVAGAVASPGVVELPSGSRVVDAVRAAGGLRPDADPDRVNLAAEIADGQRVVIPALGQEVPPEVVPSGTATGRPPADGPSDGEAGPGGLVDLNVATAEELDRLPGVGPATAAAIISHRERDGPFTSVDGLLDVRGIGEAKLEALRDLVTVGGVP